jgi:hypothetical protein
MNPLTLRQDFLNPPKSGSNFALKQEFLTMARLASLAVRGGWSFERS